MTKKQVLELAQARRLLLNGEARRVRVASGLSLAEVAAQAGVTPSAISRWETGERRPVGRPALAYARVLGELLAREDAREMARALGERMRATA